ncbi:hypothetical protein ABVK25_006772 [Lepraria finkii]|uniref:Piwi domain-containing protein n=1 Tax=Lepraria finkii TaxID=1340010 RepID=A0ABR4B603_9LECA
MAEPNTRVISNRAPTRVVLYKNLKTVDKIDETYYTNVALKANTKIRGTSHIIAGLRNDKLPLDEKENETLIVGIDIHPFCTQGMTANPSTAAMIATVDDNITQWPGSVRCQEGRDVGRARSNDGRVLVTLEI